MNKSTQKPHLSLGRILTYSLASAGLNILAITVSTWLLYFYSPPPDSGRHIYLPVAAAVFLFAAPRFRSAHLFTGSVCRRSCLRGCHLGRGHRPADRPVE